MSSEPFSVDLRKARPLGRYFLERMPWVHSGNGPRREIPLELASALQAEVYDEVWFALRPATSCINRNLAPRVEGEALDVS